MIIFQSTRPVKVQIKAAIDEGPFGYQESNNLCHDIVMCKELISVCGINDVNFYGCNHTQMLGYTTNHRTKVRITK